MSSHEHEGITAALGGPKRKLPPVRKSSHKGKPHELRIRHGNSGGHIVVHSFAPDENGTVPEPEEHVLPNKSALLNHIDQITDDQPVQGGING
jgi:hypothetical protein